MGNGSGTYHKVNEKAKEHSLVTMAGMIILLSSLIGAVTTTSDWWDSQHTSEQEFSSENDVRACENLAIRIQLAESAIYTARANGATETTSQFLREKISLLDDLRERYRLKQCALVLER